MNGEQVDFWCPFMGEQVTTTAATTAWWSLRSLPSRWLEESPRKYVSCAMTFLALTLCGYKWMREVEEDELNREERICQPNELYEWIAVSQRCGKSWRVWFESSVRRGEGGEEEEYRKSRDTVKIKIHYGRSRIQGEQSDPLPEISLGEGWPLHPLASDRSRTIRQLREAGQR